MNNIAVIQTAFLGDLLLTIPLLKRLRLTHPEAVIHVVARKGFEGIFLDLGVVDRYYSLDKSQKIKQLPKLPACDLLISPHQSLTSARLAMTVQAPQKIGYKLWWNGPVFTRRVKRPMHLPEALRVLSLLAPLDAELEHKISAYEKENPEKGALRPAPSWASMALAPPVLERLRHLASPVQPSGDYIVMAPGSVWATKRWTPGGFADLAGRLKRRGYQVFLTGSAPERSIAETVARPSGAINLCGELSLLQSLKLMAAAKAVVTNDSGAMHMASAVAAPCVAIFGPTVLAFGYQPWQNQAGVVERTDLNCRPCSPHGTARCPLGHHHCMKWIGADAVERKLFEVIAGQIG